MGDPNRVEKILLVSRLGYGDYCITLIPLMQFPRPQNIINSSQRAGRLQQDHGIALHLVLNDAANQLNRLHVVTAKIIASPVKGGLPVSGDLRYLDNIRGHHHLAELAIPPGLDRRLDQRHRAEARDFTYDGDILSGESL